MNSSRVVIISKILRPIKRTYTSGVSSPTNNHNNSPAAPSLNAPGLSNAVIQPAAQPVGPNVDPKKTGAYKSPEYYCYHNMSYFEAEIEMSKYRCPQPSNKK